jgi:ABC-type transporter Mla subunit MlaD
MKSLAVTAVLAVALVAVGSAQEGFKQTDKLVKRAEAVSKSIVEARGELEKALAQYNAIIDGTAKDPRKAHKETVKQLEKTDKKGAEVRKNVDEMDADANVYFSGWSDSLSTISNADLRKRSEERLTATKADYDGIKAAAHKAGASYQKFVPYFRDQLTFLGHDLNPSAVAGLKGDAAKLNAEARTVFADIDSSVKTISELTAKVAPQPSN